MRLQPRRRRSDGWRTEGRRATLGDGRARRRRPSQASYRLRTGAGRRVSGAATPARARAALGDHEIGLQPPAARLCRSSRDPTAASSVDVTGLGSADLTGAGPPDLTAICRLHHSSWGRRGLGPCPRLAAPRPLTAAPARQARASTSISGCGSGRFGRGGGKKRSTDRWYRRGSRAQHSRTMRLNFRPWRRSG